MCSFISFFAVAKNSTEVLPPGIILFLIGAYFFKHGRRVAKSLTNKKGYSRLVDARLISLMGILFIVAGILVTCKNVGIISLQK